MHIDPFIKDIVFVNFGCNIVICSSKGNVSTRNCQEQCIVLLRTWFFFTWFIDMSFVLRHFEIVFWNFGQLYQTKSTDLQLSSSIQQNISDTLQRSFKILSKLCVLSKLSNFSRLCLTLALNRSGWPGPVYIHEDSSCLWQYQEQISEPLKEKDDLSFEDIHLDHPEN